MKYVYLLESVEYRDQTYIGLTDDLRSRLSEHNRGHSSHTDKYKPWRLVTYVAFSDDRKAIEFERYLKTASGRAFANKRLRKAECRLLRLQHGIEPLYFDRAAVVQRWIAT